MYMEDFDREFGTCGFVASRGRSRPSHQMSCWPISGVSRTAFVLLSENCQFNLACEAVCEVGWDLHYVQHVLIHAGQSMELVELLEMWLTRGLASIW